METKKSIVMKKKALFLGLVLGGLSVLSLHACGGGDTDGGKGNDDAGNGVQYVSNGASGSSLKIVLENGKNEMSVGEEAKFLVTATDPSGSPLSFIRIFCETEHGIAILEPSSGGVAFEHTNTNGIMSGIFGGLAPGSYLVECRGPQGFNLVERVTFRVTGEVPEGFEGFPGAAGGNLGGGLYTDPLTEQVVLVQVGFITEATGTSPVREGFIDTIDSLDCDPKTVQREKEFFGPDRFAITVENNFDERVFIESVEFSLTSGGTPVTSILELGGLVINGNTEVLLTGVFTESVGVTKVYAGTSVPVVTGTFNVLFEVRGTTIDGSLFIEQQYATIVAGAFDVCTRGFFQ